MSEKYLEWKISLYIISPLRPSFFASKSGTVNFYQMQQPQAGI